MGWTFTYDKTRAEVFDAILHGFNDGCTVRKYRLVGNHLWIILDTPRHPLIWLTLLEAGGPGSGYGYKHMDETMGPCYYDCPESFLDEVPAPSGRWVTGWRAEVRKYHQKRRERSRMAIGQTWEVASGYQLAGSECRLLGKAKRGWLGVIAGTQYRVMPRMLARRVE